MKTTIHVKKSSKIHIKFMMYYLFFLFVVILVTSCSLSDEKLRVIKKAEDLANNWNDEKFKIIYANPSDASKVSDFRENSFGILRKVCEGKIYFKVINQNITIDKAYITIKMYCNGAVDFKKAGQGYEKAERLEAKKDNFIDTAMVILIKKSDSWLIEDFDY